MKIKLNPDQEIVNTIWRSSALAFIASCCPLMLILIVMVLYKPRTWCAFCPMGTMTQGICKLKNKES